MYKGASRNLQHAHRVDKIHPARGYIASADDAQAVLVSAAAMTDDALERERQSLRHENTRWLAEQQVARATGDERRVLGIGATLQTIQSRAAVVNAEIKARNIVKHSREDVEFKRLLRAEVGDERYFALADEARRIVGSAVQG